MISKTLLAVLGPPRVFITFTPRNKNATGTVAFERISKNDLGGPSSIFFGHLSTGKLIEDLASLWERLVGLGVECRYGHIRLDDLDKIMRNLD